ncbi:MAG: hypothetical protein LLG14_16570 [Nocardiaceae bacterium]|nr:hypothetical protein [Nocardiaceae bacterium]
MSFIQLTTKDINNQRVVNMTGAITQDHRRDRRHGQPRRVQHRPPPRMITRISPTHFEVWRLCLQDLND